MAFQKADLNLFVLFETIMRRRNLTTASRELGVTASAVSHGLARLRKLLNDELFVAQPDGMHPTPRAIELAPDIHEGLGKLAAALTAREFAPAESNRTFVIAGGDYVGAVLLPHLISRVVASAPNVHVKVFPVNRMDVVQQLDEDRIQIVLGWFDTLPPRIRRRTLITEHGAYLVRAGHPLTGGEVSEERLLSYPHVVVDLTGTEAEGDEGFLDERGVRRRVWMEYLLLSSRGPQGPVGRVAATVPHFSAVPPLIKLTDMVATLPERLARRAARDEGLVILQRSNEPDIAVEVIWHERSALDPGLNWLLGLMDEAADAVRQD